jgi:hypothetical protein
LFDEFKQGWLRTGRAVVCEGREVSGDPGRAFHWAAPRPPASTILRACPLPRLRFATGYAARDVVAWKRALACAGQRPVALHFNCLGRSGGHDAKRAHVQRLGLWAVDNRSWDDPQHFDTCLSSDATVAASSKLGLVDLPAGTPSDCAFEQAPSPGSKRKHRSSGIVHF